jgi:hypothetical protein
VPLFPIAQAMGHKDTRMLERVYGRQTPARLAALMARAMGIPVAENCSSIVTATSGSAGSGGPDGLPTASDPRTISPPKNSEAQGTSRSAGPAMLDVLCVPGAGIEPATRGFSGRVQEWPRPRDPGGRGRGRRAGEAELKQGDAGMGQLGFRFDGD